MSGLDHQFLVENHEVGRGVTYGPASSVDDSWTLLFITNDGRLEVLLDEPAMYTLWTEVRGVPFPNRDDGLEKDRLVRRLVELANGGDVEMLRRAVRVMEGRE